MDIYLSEAIKGPGWLTFLNAKLAAHLGNQPKITDLKVLNLANGLLFQVGESVPSALVVPASLVELAQYLRPIQVKTWTDLPMPIEAIDIDSSLWLRRFDH